MAPSPRVPVVLDTNACLLPFTDGTDLQAQLERELGAVQLFLPDVVQAELVSLAAGRGATARAAGGALRLLRDARVEAAGLAGDDGVLEVAARLGAVLVSNDRTLQREAAKRGLAVVASREKGRLGRR